MFGRFLRMESSKALSGQTSLSRRSFGQRVVASVAAGLVGTSGTTLVHVAGQSAPDVCGYCTQRNPGCTTYSEEVFCNPDGSGIKCCSCKSGAFLCEVVCLDWPSGCYTPNLAEKN